MQTKQTQFILRYLRMLCRHNSLIKVHVIYEDIDQYVSIGILTKHRYVSFKCSKSGIAYLTAETSFSILESRVITTKYLTETFNTKYICTENVTEELRDLVRSIGATVVAPSDFQSESHQKPDNQ